ncbi:MULTISPECIES: CaiB/BaiF CoA transferase family protein [unclassified Jeotgalibaca]|uniref:CaiB/BaiF CoA transferase family protein n=1 Tax=unclassified Jeotgalibaca TaxID=2621505 RepID=UPI003FD53FD4
MEFQKGSALAGLKVLDLGRVIAAPFAAAILADLGADVIKVEMPGAGDNARDNLPMKDGESTYYMNFNRSKRGITLDMKKGKDIFLKMVKEADVVLENFRPGVMDKLGYSYEELKQVNPRIIMASVSGFGQNGPYKNRAGYDPLAQAMSGIMSVTGYPDQPPVRAGASIADIMAGQNAVIGILAALQHRDRTGEGQWVDVALIDSAIVSLASVSQVYLTDHSQVPNRRGNGYVAGAPGGAYKCKDGYVVTLALGERAWLKITEVMGREDLREMGQFKTNNDRVNNYQELDSLVDAWAATLTVDEAVETLLASGLPAGPILNMEQVYNDSHVRDAREMFTKIDHPVVGEVEITNQGIKMSATSPYVRSSSPTLGQHNTEVLKEFGFSKEEIERFTQEGII